MLLALFIFFEITVLIFFMVSFFTHQEVLWAITAVLTGVLMFTSFNIEVLTYALNSTSNAYYTITTTYSYPYLMGLNMLFFFLALILGIFDLFDKYGGSFAGKK